MANSDQKNFGIAHSLSAPQQVSVDGDYLRKVKGFQYVKLYWLDFANILRLRVIPIKHFIQRLKSPRPSVAMSRATFGLVHTNLAQGTTAAGEILYVPDMRTWRPCAYARDHVAIMGWFEEKAPINGSLSVDLCPRGVLARIVDEARRKNSVKFLVGIETEFILLKSTNPVTPVDHHDWSGSNGLLAGATHTQAIEEISDALLASFIDVEMYHPEAAPGQFEIITAPLPPLEAADATVLIRDIIRNVASKYDLHATFAPRVFDNAPGTSAHTHISIHGPDRRTADGMSPAEQHFLAGVLDHIPAFAAFTLPTRASYKRMVDGYWSGGTYIHYGTENREAPVRICNATSINARNLEMRFVDATASPYLALSAILGAGADGIDRQTPLTITDITDRKIAAELSETERGELGITQRMPLSLEEAREKMQKDPVVRDLFGENFIQKYLAVNQTLDNVLENSNGEVDPEAAKLRRLVQFY